MRTGLEPLDRQGLDIHRGTMMSMNNVLQVLKIRSHVICGIRVKFASTNLLKRGGSPFPPFRHRIIMSQSRQAELRHRIRGLTTVLYKFEVLKQPSKRPRSAHSLLPHVTTLLTCSDQYDKEAKKVISVASSVEPGLAMRILVVVQNARARSSVESISVQVVEKRQGSFDEVVTGYYSHSFG